MRQSSSLVRVGASIAATIILVGLVAGCGSGGGESSATNDSKSPVPGGTLRVAMTAEPTTLEPREATEADTINVLDQIVEPLYLPVEGGKIESNLVTKTVKSSDNRRWTISLRPGVKFSTGQPMTAKDVVFSIEAARESAAYSELFKPIAKVSAQSPSVVEIDTSTPMPSLEADLAFYVAGVIPNNYGGASEKEFAQHPIGTGPFELDQWQHGTGITLAPNGNYWKKGLPYFEKVEFVTVADENSRVAQLRGGQLDAIPAPPFADIAEIEQNSELAVEESDETRTDVLEVNINKGIFQNPKAREALSLAVDREALVKVALNGHGTPAGSFLPSALPFSDASIQPPAQDLAKAKELLAQAVSETGEKPDFTLNTIAGEDFSGLASQVIQQDLAAAGFAVKLQPLDIAAFIGELEKSEFDVELGWFAPTVLDPSEITFFLTGGLELSGADVTAYSKLVEEAAAEPNEEKREALYHELQQLVDEEMVMIPLDYQPFVWGLDSRITGFKLNPGGGNPLLAEAAFAE